MRRRVITRVTTSVRSCLAAKTSSGTANSIPFRYNRRSCHCLPVSIKWDIQPSSAMPLQSHLPSAPAHPSQSRNSFCQKVLRGFPCSVVYTCTLFFHEFSIWENRNTFLMVCKRGISILYYILLCLYIHRHAIRNAMVVSVIPAAMLTAKRIV